MNELMLAAISGNQILNAVIWLVIAAVIYWILSWALREIALPEPFAKAARVFLVLFAAVAVINAVLMLVGKPFIAWP